jgi:hypothetical protein
MGEITAIFTTSAANLLSGYLYHEPFSMLVARAVIILSIKNPAFQGVKKMDFSCRQIFLKRIDLL